jgi:hypothetical protein
MRKMTRRLNSGLAAPQPGEGVNQRAGTFHKESRQGCGNVITPPDSTNVLLVISRQDYQPMSYALIDNATLTAAQRATGAVAVKTSDTINGDLCFGEPSAKQSLLR